jgi:DNA-directed RNA polymerase subunit F
MEPYKRLVLKEPSSIQKLLKQLPQENGIIEINNYLASISLLEMERTPISKIESKYNLKKYNNHVSDLQKLLQSFCTHYFNLELPNPGFLAVNKMIQVLGMDNKDSDIVIRQVSLENYQNRCVAVVETGNITEEQRNYLDSVEKIFQIPAKTANEILDKVRKEKVRSTFNKILADGEISPEEEEELALIQENLGVTLSYEEKVSKDIEKMRAIWRINHAELTPVFSDVNLHKNEFCYFESRANWYEQRAVTGTTNYSGPTGRIRVTKGVYYRYGQINHGTSSHQEMTLIDTGTIHITNKRLIFMGTKKNTTINFDSILGIIPYSDGLGIQKASGKSPNISILNDPDYATAILMRLMRD